MKKVLVASLLASFVSSSLLAHTALMNCFDNGDGTIGCEAGYSDGSSASGVPLKVLQNGKTLYEVKLDKNSETTFKKPQGDYSVVLDGGDGHAVRIQSSSILK